MIRRISNPYEKIARKTERTNNQKLVQWMNEIIQGKNLHLGIVEQETSGSDRKQPDIVIKKRPGSEEILCVIELKPPAFLDPLSETELMEPARIKASKRQAPYFCTSNFRELVWFNTEKANRMDSLEKQIVQRYTLSSMTDPNTIEEPGIKSAIYRGIERFLIDLVEISTGKKAEPKHPIDEILVYRLQNTIKTLSVYYKQIIEEKVKGDRKFSKQLQSWFIEQGWSFSFQDQDYNKAARQTAYLLVNKILFYSVIQPIRRLDPLEIPKSLKSGGLLQSTLQGFFNLVLKIDYETIYSTDFIDQIAFPDVGDVVEEIKELVEVLSKYDFSKIGYDVIGRIFEKLIPDEERHILGQYFTNPDVVDLILRFCLKHETDKVLDPGCGAGTFLVRAYQHKKLMNQRLTHEEILKTIWGNDIAKFPAHLTTINLAINDLRSDENYPRVIQKDFFDLLPDRVEFSLPEAWRRVQIKGLGKIEKVLEHPRFFNCIVGNPPYTRQEEIEDIQEKSEGYKDQLIKKALYLDGKTFAQISKRAGIYAYFFIHGTKFLQNGGRFGFIVSNSWLDVDYGKGVQEHFLSQYKIISIIESKVERWFEDADINTVIVILEKASGDKLKKERDENLVRFAYLKKPLRHFIPLAESMWEKEVGRLEAIDKLIKNILGHTSYYENEEFRIYPKSQRELWEEGYDSEEDKYVGSKWGKYLRAPEIFFTILEKGKGKLIPLKQAAKVRFGIKTGANEFFYLTEEQINKWKIEKEFWMHKDGQGQWVPNYVIKSPRECHSILVKSEDLKYRILMIHKDKKALKGTNVLKYIELGEKKGYHKRPTCASREKWYDVGDQIPPPCLWFKAFNDRVVSPINSVGFFASDRFYPIYPIEGIDEIVLGALLNCSLQSLLVELSGRVNLGEGALDNMTYEAAAMYIVDPKIVRGSIATDLKKEIKNLGNYQIRSVFDEFGGITSIDNLENSRRSIDKLIMVDILGLTEEEQLEVYQAVIDLVKTRLERAKSLKKIKKTKEGIDIDSLTQDVLGRIGEANLVTFYKSHIAAASCLNINLPERVGTIEIEKSLFGWRLKIGKKAIDCPSEAHARYLRVFAEMGWDKATIPKDSDYLATIIDQWENLFKAVKATLEEYTSSILQNKTRDMLIHRVWATLREKMHQDLE
ncbi:MAG: SAM-dependent DNA methyltransferase [Deltaproteobacteria bacterium]|nr:SAM-dependent DNA methyltransferase [Deltaproteobacteria bacterium]